MLTSEPERLPNSPTILALLAKLAPCLPTKRKDANVEMAVIATGALKSANVSLAPATSR